MTATPLAGFVAIPIGDVRPSPNNPREHLHDIDELAASIKAGGLVQPIVVQKLLAEPGYQIVAGHRRSEACARLGWAKVPCIVRRDMLPDEELVAMLVENGQRSGLDPIEEARALRKLVRSGITLTEVAKRVGKATSHVSSRLLLLDLPLAEQEELRAGHYTITHATRLVRDAREAQRRRTAPEARPVGRPKGATTKPYFGPTHALAAAVRARCDHRCTPKVGGVGCGACWEAVIRHDEQEAAS
jgi:ParB family transcriptional regulator, chromosome partitioning protein